MRWLASAAVFLLRPLRPRAEKSVAQQQHEYCWRSAYLQREECCDTRRYGRYGDQRCWTSGYSYARCCSEDPEASAYVMWIRDGLTYHLVVKADIASALKAKDFKLNIDSAFLQWASGGGKLLSSGPVATVAALLRAFEPDAAPGAVADAFASFLDVERPLRAHLKSGFPVFALFALITHRARHQPAGGSTVLGVHESYLQQQQLRGGSAFLDNRTEPSEAMGRCSRGCASSPVQAGECVKACVAGAAALPLPHSLRSGCSARPVSELLRTSLLEEAERAMSHLQRSRALLKPDVWVELHRLQVMSQFRASCPDGSMRYTTDSEPPYDVCLPVPGVALRGGSAPNEMDYHMFSSILKHGRWKDCDLLKDAAIFAGMLPCPSCLAVDVGAALGACSGYLLAMGFRVHALDPVLWNVALLRAAHWEAECSGRLTVHHAAASDVEALRDGAARSGRAWAAEGEQPVGTVRLDGLLRGVPGTILLKIDVEGEEVLVLRGARDLFAEKRVHAVMLEVHCGMLRQAGLEPWDAPEILVGYGFTIEVHHPSNFGYADKNGFKAAEDWLKKHHEVPNIQVLAILPPTLW